MTVITGKALQKSALKLPLALSGGATATLSDYAGQWLVLYFYPKDNTPGCTTEGLDFNGLLPKFKKARTLWCWAFPAIR